METFGVEMPGLEAALAERLGLEHAAITSAPDLAALRSAGVESPSGRLIVDLSRLRESRATTSGTSELTLVAVPSDDNSGKGSGLAQETGASRKDNFTRVDVQLGQKTYLTRRTLVSALIGVAVLLAGFTFLVIRTSNVIAPANVNLSASPSPNALPSPLPSPSPTATPKRQPTPTPEDKKKLGKVGRFVNGIKKIFKKPF